MCITLKFDKLVDLKILVRKEVLFCFTFNIVNVINWKGKAIS